MDIRETIQSVARIARKKGWWSKPKTFLEAVALMHSELSEAVEHYRNGHLVKKVWYEGDGKPDGAIVELADVVIRIFDYVGNTGNADLFVEVLQRKINYNEQRPYRHGGKVA